MEELKPVKQSTGESLSLQNALSPIWTSTYYTGLTFDWCCRIPRQSRASFVIHCFIIFISFVFQLYTVSSVVIQLSRSIINSETEFNVIVSNMIQFSEQPLILFVWLYFLLKKTNTRAFFDDWNRMEEQYAVNNKGMDSAKIKRTYLTVYILYYTYGFVCLSLTTYAIINNFDAISERDDLIASYYPDLILYTPYKILVAIQSPMWVVLYIVMFPLIDIVPTFVYYRAAKMVEAITWEIREITNKESSSVSKYEIVHSLRSRFETLTAMVDRANRLFGSMVILCQGILFFIICCAVYTFLFAVKGSSKDDTVYVVMSVFVTTLVLYPARLLFTISFMSKLNSSSDQLLSAVSYFSHQRELYADKEERRVVRSFIGRLNQTKLAAYPSGFYKIKPSVFLTLLSLIVTYTVILMQTNDSPTKVTMQENYTCISN